MPRRTGTSMISITARRLLSTRVMDALRLSVAGIRQLLLVLLLERGGLPVGFQPQTLRPLLAESQPSEGRGRRSLPVNCIDALKLKGRATVCLAQSTPEPYDQPRTAPRHVPSPLHRSSRLE